MKPNSIYKWKTVTSFIWTFKWPENAEGQRAVVFSTVGIWLSCWCWCPQSMAAPQRPLLCTPSYSHMEHQACWTCMPLRGSHDNSVWHFSFICVLPFLLIHGLSSNFIFLSLFLSPQSSLSSLQGLPLVLHSEKKRIAKEVWGLLRNWFEVWSCYLKGLSFLLDMIFVVAWAVLVCSA